MFTVSNPMCKEDPHLEDLWGPVPQFTSHAFHSPGTHINIHTHTHTHKCMFTHVVHTCMYAQAHMHTYAHPYRACWDHLGFTPGQSFTNIHQPWSGTSLAAWTTPSSAGARGTHPSGGIHVSAAPLEASSPGLVGGGKCSVSYSCPSCLSLT